MTTATMTTPIIADEEAAAAAVEAATAYIFAQKWQQHTLVERKSYRLLVVYRASGL